MPYKDKKKANASARRIYYKNKLKPGWLEHRRTKGRRDYAIHREDRIAKVQKRYKELHPPMIGSCPICQLDKHLVWDHDHVTDEFRGYICNDCNLVLGWAKDSINTLLGAIKYLKGRICPS